jgi:hypothetical protein
MYRHIQRGSIEPNVWCEVRQYDLGGVADDLVRNMELLEVRALCLSRNANRAPLEERIVVEQSELDEHGLDS